jgi:hypothetical protein
LTASPIGNKEHPTKSLVRGKHKNIINDIYTIEYLCRERMVPGPLARGPAENARLEIYEDTKNVSHKDPRKT